ncbi:hypothetical protein PAP18089_04145 [Pandoraea apista]|uniref:Uncharacterized protein n=2 Tax=Pandoraea TaxID=93217 RepID=A0A5E4XYQ6_9BURK|nr:hypothetical protein PEP31012_04210 [Pandoraea eparura]VVG73142.1 hypothetical protein PAP18089_04145 [Pandoraea apista]
MCKASKVLLKALPATPAARVFAESTESGLVKASSFAPSFSWLVAGFQFLVHRGMDI